MFQDGKSFPQWKADRVVIIYIARMRESRQLCENTQFGNESLGLPHFKWNVKFLLLLLTNTLVRGFKMGLEAMCVFIQV